MRMFSSTGDTVHSFAKLHNLIVMSKIIARKNFWGGDLPIVSVYIATFYSFARLLLSAVMVTANLVEVGGGGQN